MTDPQGYSYIWAPIVALCVVGLLILILRWAFPGRSTTLMSAPARPGGPEEYGLLVPVAAPASAEEGAHIRDRLTTAGVRVTLAQTHAGLRVLVWPADAPLARETLETLDT